ncbi:M55 family metallopeptidase [Candidatus Fermentibacteria bacterium]|nr:M55 family metallopeptidase [Candidatus Fermentibacteria bacterium]
MKIYISADIEGVTGATHDDETDAKKSDYGEFRDQMTAEVAAACEGALAAGADEVWVKDAHDTGRNLQAGKLPKEVRLVRGWSGHPLSMAQELDGSFAAMLMIGYHSRAGLATSPLAHTMCGVAGHIKVNDRFASEFLLHGYAAASVGVPVAFVSGDQGLCDEVAVVNPAIGTVAVKQGVGDSTINLHPAAAVERIRTGVEASLRGDVKRCLIPIPDRFVLEIGYRTHVKAYRAGFYPGAHVVDAFTVRFEHADYMDVLRTIMFVL